jgi:hypothetical protein
MEYKNLLDLSNLVISILQGSMGRMGLSSELILAQVKDHMATPEIQNTFDGYKMKITGADVQSVVKSWEDVTKEIGATQRVIIEDLSDTQVVVDIGECAFATATKIIRGDDKDAIPPCPFIAMLTAAIEVNTGKNTVVESCKWKPELNTSVFTISME